MKKLKDIEEGFLRNAVVRAVGGKSYKGSKTSRGTSSQGSSSGGGDDGDRRVPMSDGLRKRLSRPGQETAMKKPGEDTLSFPLKPGSRKLGGSAGDPKKFGQKNGLLKKNPTTESVSEGENLSANEVMALYAKAHKSKSPEDKKAASKAAASWRKEDKLKPKVKFGATYKD